MAKISQSGSTLRFVFVGTLLTGLLIGGAFLVRQQTIQSVASAQETTTSEPVVVQQQSEPEEVQKQEEVAVQEEVVDTPTAEKSTELPKTGSAEVSGVVILLACLSFVVTSYVRSRHLDPLL
jgi:Na+-transporting NADH:ubiquinone oxidoreductase subunit NqrC